MIDPGNPQEKKEIDQAAQPPDAEQPSNDENSEQIVSVDEQDSSESVEESEPPRRRGKKRKKRFRQVTEEELMPHPSIWPFALAVSVAIMLGGFALNTIVLVVGIILVIACVIGWSLERR